VEYTSSQRKLTQQVEKVLANTSDYDDQVVERCQRLWSAIREPDISSLKNRLLRFNHEGLPQKVKDALLDCDRPLEADRG
jgi:hypothetical protein